MKTVHLKRRPRPFKPEPHILTLNWQNPVEYKSQLRGLDDEYHKSREIETKYHKSLKGVVIHDLDEAFSVCKRICVRMGVTRYPHIYQIAPTGWVSGYCSGKNIVLQSHRIGTRTLLHELAHYIVFRERLSGKDGTIKSHGKDYLWVLDMVYRVFLGKE